MPYRDFSLEHPDVTAMRRTGYARGHEPVDYICPCCGADCEKVYVNFYEKIVGCDRCVEVRFAEDEL